MVFLVYLLPFLTDVTIGIFLFAYPVAAAKAGADTLFIAGIPAVFSVCYLLGSLVLSRFTLSKSGYYRIMVLSIAVLIICAVLSYFCIVPLTLIYGYVFVIGTFAALFFVSFQVIMATISHRQPLHCNVSNYNVSWCLGLGFGPFISGILYEYDARLSFVAAAVICLAVGVLLFVVWKKSASAISTGKAPKIVRPSTRPQVYFGFALIFLGAATGVFIRVLYPAYGLTLGFSTSLAGGLIFAFLITQAILSFFIRYVDGWLEKRHATIAAALLGILALITIGVTSSIPLLFAAFIVFGIFQTVFFYYAVLYALADMPRASQNVSMNEMIVGASGIISPLAFGSLASRSGYPVTFLVIAATLGVMFTAAFIFKTRLSARRGYGRTRSKGVRTSAR